MKSNIRGLDRLRHWERNPYEYVSAAIWGCYLLLTRDFAPLRDRLRSLLGRLREVPRLLREGQQNLTNPPRVWTEVALEALAGAVGYFEHEVPRQAAPPMADDLVAQIAEASRAAAEALRSYGRFLEQDLLGRSNGEYAIGEDLFEEILREEHFLDYTAESMLSTGRRLYEEIRLEMERLAQQIAPGRPLREVVDELGREYPSSESLLDHYRQEMLRARDFALQKKLVSVPVAEKLELAETPQAFWSIIPYAMYMPPAPFEDVQTGTFFVTPVDPLADAERRAQQLAGHSLHKIPVVALHEGYPGHHLQLVWANTNPSKVRKQFFSTLFIEGWAFYCEELMERYGFISDRRSRLARLSQELWRAARIIADVSLHTAGMTIPQAVDLMLEAGLEPVNALAEVRRYSMSPTQPMSYLIGKLEIMKMADRYRQWKGGKFDLADFHAALLSTGSLPPALAAKRLFAESSATTVWPAKPAPSRARRRTRRVTKARSKSRVAPRPTKASGKKSATQIKVRTKRRARR
ncbi:MAG: DUF885 domain-containing protein [Chloroflexi bacterium]|nr:DUF885 domain-containing protein [Chloroflexota bacterium]